VSCEGVGVVVPGREGCGVALEVLAWRRISGLAGRAGRLDRSARDSEVLQLGACLLRVGTPP